MFAFAVAGVHVSVAYMCARAAAVVGAMALTLRATRGSLFCPESAIQTRGGCQVLRPFSCLLICALCLYTQKHFD